MTNKINALVLKGVLGTDIDVRGGVEFSADDGDTWQKMDTLTSEQSGLYEASLPEKQKRRFGTTGKFMERLTKSEFSALSAAVRSSDDLNEWWMRVTLLDKFWLDHPSVSQVLGLLAYEGIISAERALEIPTADFDA